jgi:hypothetical protein
MTVPPDLPPLGGVLTLAGQRLWHHLLLIIGFAWTPNGPTLIQPDGEKKIGDNFDVVRSAMQRLSRSFQPKELADRAFELY